MLSVEFRTMDYVRVLELWETDKESLVDELLMDYNELKNAYRELIRQYNQNTYKGSVLSRRHLTFERINYQKELDIEEIKYGRVKLSKDLGENIVIANALLNYKHYEVKSREAYTIKEFVRLKAREIESLLLKLGVKVKYEQDFEVNTDKWLHSDIDYINENEI